MRKEKIKAVCFGEILWDVFRDKERIGGAPLNVATRLSATGIRTDMISRVGQDEKGKKLLAYLEEKGIGRDNVQVDLQNPTGMVNVELDKNRSASYEIAYPSAWDKIELNDQVLKAVREAEVFIFGSLVCRDEVSRKTLFECLDIAKYKVFDLNLRPPHYDIKVITELMLHSDFLKFNDEELYEIAESLGSAFNSLEQNLMFISEKTSTSSICVTKGSHGAVFLHNKKLFYNSGFKIKVKDTVGAGDSFLASLIAKILQNEDPQKALDYSCAVGALVAGSEGATPILKREEIRKFMNPV